MKKSNKVLLGAAVLGAMVPHALDQQAGAANVSLNVQAIIGDVILVTATSSINFGNLSTVGPSSGTVTLDANTAGARTASNGFNLAGGTIDHPGQINLTAAASALLDVSLSNALPITLTGAPTADTIKVTKLTLRADTTAAGVLVATTAGDSAVFTNDTDGAMRIYVGGVLKKGAAAIADGTYNSATDPIFVINYN